MQVKFVLLNALHLDLGRTPNPLDPLDLDLERPNPRAHQHNRIIQLAQQLVAVIQILDNGKWTGKGSTTKVINP